MSIKQIIQSWSQGVRSKSLVLQGLGSGTHVPTTRPRNQRSLPGMAQAADPILLMDAHRDADRRLQERFEESRREETNIMKILIPMDDY